MDLVEPNTTTLPRFLARVAERAVADHEGRVRSFPSGLDLCEEYAEGYRNYHPRLAGTVYRTVRRTLLDAERDWNSVRIFGEE